MTDAAEIIAAAQPTPEQAEQIAMGALSKVLSLFWADLHKDEAGLQPAPIEIARSFIKPKDRSLQATMMYNSKTKLFQLSLSRLEWPMLDGTPIFMRNGVPLKPKHKTPPFILFTRAGNPQLLMQFVGLEKDNVPGCSYDCDRKGWVDDNTLTDYEQAATKAAVASDMAKIAAPVVQSTPVASDNAVTSANASQLLEVAVAASAQLDSANVEDIDDDDDVDDKVAPSTP